MLWSAHFFSHVSFSMITSGLLLLMYTLSSPHIQKVLYFLPDAFFSKVCLFICGPQQQSAFSNQNISLCSKTDRIFIQSKHFLQKFPQLICLYSKKIFRNLGVTSQKFPLFPPVFSSQKKFPPRLPGKMACFWIWGAH